MITNFSKCVCLCVCVCVCARVRVYKLRLYLVHCRSQALLEEDCFKLTANIRLFSTLMTWPYSKENFSSHFPHLSLSLTLTPLPLELLRLVKLQGNWNFLVVHQHHHHHSKTLVQHQFQTSVQQYFPGIVLHHHNGAPKQRAKQPHFVVLVLWYWCSTNTLHRSYIGAGAAPTKGERESGIDGIINK